MAPSSKGKSLLFQIIAALIAAPCLALEVEPPFWKKKEEVYRRIKEERAIVVSVTASPMDKKKPQGTRVLKMLGAGHVKLRADQVYQIAREFSHLPKMSSYVKRVDYDANEQMLFLHGEAFRYHARMFIKLEYPPPAPDRSEIRFKILRGDFEGMEGRFLYETAGQQVTEISMTANYSFEKLPIPQFFVEFGLEVVLQKMAARMRSYSEDYYRKKD